MKHIWGKERQAELRSYKNLMVAEKMTSNKDIASTNTATSPNLKKTSCEKIVLY
ncbi:coiled-coil domain-containing protein 25 [Dorcoceras hygrometricum]|uniref:Coiled-coil domain-containing protein 25 n=1 Tax=Dorcoceras hygrometricum TaxID=472368 RepID=A0A2Z6ZQT3_9LAMI|nr:coiled-coil domain-containing protein 25 [Dorcoceras hygrometricum]